MKRRYAFSKGDQVMYSREFLRSIGCYAGEICFLIGEIVSDPEVISPGHPTKLLKIRWVGHSPAWCAGNYQAHTSEYLDSEQLVLDVNLEPSPFAHILWDEVK